MNLTVLASGSKGNATFLEMDGVRFLIDAGISATRLRQSLAAMGIAAEDLDGIFVTHEHIDHVRGLSNFVKKSPLPIYAREGTLRAISGGFSRPECLLPVAKHISIGGLSIHAFSISHDAAEPVGYRVEGSEVFALATDLGFVSQSVQEAIEGADILVLEANHDPAMLQNGAYPWHLKRRIASNQGHLANIDAAWAVARMKKTPRAVHLAHLSEENNAPEIARAAVERILTQQGKPTEIFVAGM